MIDRRNILSGGAGLLATLAGGGPGFGQTARDARLTVAFPADVPMWDPNARALAPA